MSGKTDKQQGKAPGTRFPRIRMKGTENMKQKLSMILAVIMLLSAVSLAEEIPADSYLYTGPAYDYDRLTVGNVTAMTGSFTTRLFSYSTSDLDVNSLVNGYNLVEWKSEAGNFGPTDNVVSGLTVMDNPDGTRSYLFVLYDDLFFSDGTPVTAYDYAFSILLNTAPQAREIGGQTDLYPAIEGIGAYRNGESETVPGITVINDSMLILTVSKEYRPYFYELGLLMCDPLPVHVIAPGCEVRDDGNGACISGPFTAELLSKTLLDSETGYVTHPSAVSGAYRLISFDGVTAELEINEYYKGNSKGQKPSIGHITYTLADRNTMMEKLENGEFGLLNKVVESDLTDSGIMLAGSGNFGLQNYARIGQSAVSFCCEKEDTVGRKAVRQAIACCLDKDAMVAAYTGNYGLRMDGYYGLGQWMYGIMTGTLAAPDPETDENMTPGDADKWNELNYDGIKVYEPDTNEAVKLLEADGWTLNENGDAYDPARDTVRCRKVNDEIVPLKLTMLYPEGNRMAEQFDACFVQNLSSAGIQLEIIPAEWNQLLRYYYRQDARDCDMIYISTNFNLVFDPWPTFSTADAAVGKTNYTAINSPELEERARDMSKTEPGDSLGYMQKWILFQECFADELPSIPVYGNVYFDFYTRCLHDYDIGAATDWGSAVVGAYMGDAVNEGAAAEEAFEEDGADIFD